MTIWSGYTRTARGCNHQSFACPVTALICGRSGTQIYDYGIRGKDSDQP